MTEKDKMLAGKAYLGSEEQLVKERQYAKQVLFKFNNMNPVLVEERHNLLRELLGQTKENFYFEPPFRCDYGYNIEIGNNFYANYNLTILDCAKVKIGDNVLIAPNVSLFTAGHPIHHEPRNQEYEYALPIMIGNNVWIGVNATIVGNVVIGNDVLIAPNTYINCDIPDHSIVFGNPCIVKHADDATKDYINHAV